MHRHSFNNKVNDAELPANVMNFRRRFDDVGCSVEKSTDVMNRRSISYADMLPIFSQSIRNVSDFFGAKAEPWILNALSSKLNGGAAEAFAARLTQYESIVQFSRDSKTQYYGREETDGLKRKLQSMK